jgi:glucose-1-phosphate thymidylyltransferase
MKGIILAGGSGTRVYPTTKVLSKQILPVYDKPTIYYPLSTLIKLGVKDVLIISNKLHSFFDLLGDGSNLGINITYKEQMKPRGIAEALIIGEKFIGYDEVVLALGDNIFTGVNYQRVAGATIVGYRVSNPQDYGVVEYNNDLDVTNIVEKPTNPKSDVAVTGLYFYDSSAPERAKKLTPSGRNELEITDLNKSYLESGDLSLSILNSEYAWFDTGDTDQMFEATMYIKSIQNRTNQMIGSVELETYKAGNINIDELNKLLYNMPECKYKQSIVKAVSLPSL